MTSSWRSTLFLTLAYLAFFASGAASLIAEVTWNRMLIVVVGNSLSAAAMIIIIFMAGLGLGSWAGGRWFGRRGDTLVPYALMELTIGASVLLSPALFRVLTGIFTDAAAQVDDRAVLTLVRVAVTMLALFGPAFLMGATFPAIVSGVQARSVAQRSARTGYLYSINTLGAAVGTYAAGYHLLLELGVQFTLNVAGALYAAAAACALVAHVLQRADRAPAPAAAAAPAADPAPVRRRYLLGATFAVGFVALAYEVLLTRLAILYLGNNVAVFSLVLTAFLLGTGISAVAGTWLYGRLERRTGAGDRLFPAVAAVAGVLIVAIPYVLLSGRVPGIDHLAREAALAKHNPLPVLALLILPTTFIGGMLPLAIRMLARGGAGQATRSAATLYALNTAGGVLGAALANHVLVPAIGVQNTLLCLFAVCGVVAAARPAAGLGARLAPAGVVALAVVLALTLPGLMELYASQLAVSTGAREAEVRLLHEGRAATVTVIDQHDARLGSYRDMYLNGVEEASTRYWHTQLFKLLGMLPVALHEGDAPKEALVIAFGAGITAGSVLASEDVASLDVVDLNPDIEGINDLFTEVNGDVFHDPRFTFHNDDGRNYLVTSPKQYDLIIGDSTHPCAYDSWILYTEEFYRAAKRRLKPGGVIAQWVPVLGAMQGELASIHLNTVRKVFPNVTFWMVYGSDQAFFLATPEPLAIDPAALQDKLDRLPDWFGAPHYHMDTVARVAGYFWMDDPAMDAMAMGDTRINSDDRHYFVKQSAVWPLPPARQLPAFQASVLPHLPGADPALVAAVQREQAVAGLLTSAVFFRERADLLDAYCLDARNGNARYLMSLETGGELPDPETFCAARDVERYRRLAAQQPENPLALNGLADALSRADRWEEALPVARRAVELAPDNGMVLDTLGWVQHRLGHHEKALLTLRRAREDLPDHPIVLFHLATVHAIRGDCDAARRLVRAALDAGRPFPQREQAEQLLDDCS